MNSEGANYIKYIDQSSEIYLPLNVNWSSCQKSAPLRQLKSRLILFLILWVLSPICMDSTRELWLIQQFATSSKKLWRGKVTIKIKRKKRVKREKLNMSKSCRDIWQKSEIWFAKLESLRKYLLRRGQSMNNKGRKNVKIILYQSLSIYSVS